MGDGFQFLDIILLAMVAGFILLRLRSVLGRRTGTEQQRQSPLAEGAGNGKVVPLPRPENAPAPIPAGPASPGLQRIQAADRAFDPAVFLTGARGAYEMIVQAFAQGDVGTLRNFLSPEVFNDFDAAIRERQRLNQRQETSLVGLKSAEIVEADLKNTMAEVTVKITAELINVTRDSGGQVVAGSPNEVATVTDVWTFARDVTSPDPNWTLVGTSTPA